jgi:hypothetical protein
MGLSKRKFDKLLSNIPGWSTKRKIVVFESDDWGSIRMPSKDAYERLRLTDVPLDTDDSKRYNRFDCLESAIDLEVLFETLTAFKDSNGCHPRFTAVSLVANPDFDKIKGADFSEYFFESFIETLKRYNQIDAYDLWKEGINNNIFIPQFHGREHVNVAMWMRLLRKKDPLTLKAFEEGFWGFRHPALGKLNLQASFDLEEKSDLIVQREILLSGLRLFEEIHGYKAEFFVPPNGPFNNSLCPAAFEGGIKFLCAPKVQIEPQGMGETKKVFNYLGKKSKSGLTITTRNCLFEPSKGAMDWVGICLSDIDAAFTMKKPAVISTHRVNYIGVHDPKNREHGVKQLKELITRILKKWPGVEFLSSDQLGKLIPGN